LDAAFLSAISPLAGSVIGGLTTWLSQRSQARAGQIAHDLARREDLIRDFIIAASKTYSDAIVNNEPKMPELIDLYAMISRMRVLAMPRSVAGADIVMRSMLETYSAPNRTIGDLRELVKDGGQVDPLRDFARRRGRSCTRSQVFKATGWFSIRDLADPPQVTTLGALRPVRASISASECDSPMRLPSAA